MSMHAVSARGGGVESLGAAKSAAVAELRTVLLHAGRHCMRPTPNVSHWGMVDSKHSLLTSSAAAAARARRSTARLSSGQRTALNDIEDVRREERDSEPYVVYEHVSQASAHAPARREGEGGRGDGFGQRSAVSGQQTQRSVPAARRWQRAPRAAARCACRAPPT
jgi:hypothetical protein